MAITKSARRAIGVAKRRRVFNLRHKDTVRGAIKEFERAVSAGKKDEASKLLPKVYKELDKAAKTKLIKKGNASRRKSRFSAKIAKMK